MELSTQQSLACAATLRWRQTYYDPRSGWKRQYHKDPEGIYDALHDLARIFGIPTAAGHKGNQLIRFYRINGVWYPRVYWLR